MGHVVETLGSCVDVELVTWREEYGRCWWERQDSEVVSVA